MYFTVLKEALLKPLLLVAGSIERRHLQPVLSNVLIVVKSRLLSLTGTNLEVELVARIGLQEEPGEIENGEFTLNARKLIDICRSFPEHARLSFQIEGMKATIRHGKTRFSLACLPVEDFPRVKEGVGETEFSLQQSTLKSLIDTTHFVMAEDDVRVYMNGIHFIFQEDSVRASATDGHRLMQVALPVKTALQQPLSLIIPHKAIAELQRLFQEGSEEVGLVVSASQIRAITRHYSFTAKLIASKFPNFKAALPHPDTRHLIIGRDLFKEALLRVSALFSDKNRGARMGISDGKMRLEATNADRDEAEEEIPIIYEGDATEIGINVNYLTDFLLKVETPEIQISFSGPDGGVLMQPYYAQGVISVGAIECRYLVMPMRL